ncbi:hypothetical protein GCM10010390_19890 [Streptomyces mordarskii]|uniref:Uncharacterized protein n=1 Tax=Streptomyces mordarskii TaxID=1226758 RepID=A0ABP3MC95_9ACTN
MAARRAGSSDAVVDAVVGAVVDPVVPVAAWASVLPATASSAPAAQPPMKVRRVKEVMVSHPGEAAATRHPG